MAAIDRDVLLASVLTWLPSENTLTDAQILELAEEVISNVGDDDIYYKEVRCKTLKAVGTANMSNSSLDSGVKREKTYMEEVEYYNMLNANMWGKWLDNLPCLCADLGYTGLPSKNTGAFYANVATNISIPCGADPYGSLDDLACPDD